MRTCLAGGQAFLWQGGKVDKGQLTKRQGGQVARLLQKWPGGNMLASGHSWAYGQVASLRCGQRARLLGGGTQISRKPDCKRPEFSDLASALHELLCHSRHLCFPCGQAEGENPSRQLSSDQDLLLRQSIRHRIFLSRRPGCQVADRPYRDVELPSGQVKHPSVQPFRF